MQAPQELVDRYLAQGETLGAALTYSMIEAMDAGIGRIDETLADLGCPRTRSSSSRATTARTSEKLPV